MMQIGYHEEIQLGDTEAHTEIVCSSIGKEQRTPMVCFPEC